MLLILTAFFQISVPQFHREYRPGAHGTWHGKLDQGKFWQKCGSNAI